MSKGQNTGGLMSSAGLVRYFDEDSNNSITVDPKTVLAVVAFLGLVVQALTAF